MISAKKLLRMGRKWQNLAALRHKRITFLRAGNNRSTTRGIDKGHFAVYTCDEIRFLMPLAYLKNEIFQELLKVAEEEYGLQTDGPIRLPFESMCIEYIISLIERHVCDCEELGTKVLMSIASEGCLLSSSSRLERNHTHLLIPSF